MSVIFSTSGVFLGLTISQVEPSTIMTGTSIVGLAGIVVNNNIVLIDTYNRLKTDFPEKNIEELITETCMSRLRPVLLTTITIPFYFPTLLLGIFCCSSSTTDLFSLEYLLLYANTLFTVVLSPYISAYAIKLNYS